MSDPMFIFAASDEAPEMNTGHAAAGNTTGQEFQCSFNATETRLELRPLHLRAACAFIAAHHRHNAPPRGHKFSIGAYHGDRLIAVLVAGRPVSRIIQDGFTLEIGRTCGLEGRPKLANGHADPAMSMLMGAACRAAKALGYRRVITYTQGEEDGRSLKAAGFVVDEELAARGSWAQSSVVLHEIRDQTGTGGVARRRWVKVLTKCASRDR